MANPSPSTDLTPYRFKKGQSGNPAGRVPMPAKIKAIWEAKSPEMAKELLNMALHSRDEAIRLKAIEMIQNRMWGKPMTPSEVKVETTGIQQAHLQALHEINKRRAAKRAEEAAERRQTIDVTPVAVDRVAAAAIEADSTPAAGIEQVGVAVALAVAS